MRLPEPIYESLPYLYVIAGTLFNVGIIYLGPNAPWARYYLAIGAFCTLCGLIVFYHRQVRRRKIPSVELKEAEVH